MLEAKRLGSSAVGHRRRSCTVARVTADLIVFDCDGVLVDSEALVVEVEAKMLTAAGFPTSTADIIERFVGLSYATMMAQLAADHGRPVPDELSQRIQQAALDEFPARLQPVPGVDELLSELALPRCVASSSDLDRIALSLDITDLTRHFEHDKIFSAQMVERGKPAPDLFELAASQLGVDPSACLVIEDSPAGVAAAAAAGMEVVGFLAGGHATPNLGTRLLAAGASEVFVTADKLAARLAS